MSEKDCSMCKWFVGVDWSGECRRFPPCHVTNYDDKYPTVSMFTDICGEFQPKGKE